MNKNNPLSAMSYTNKDFGTIFVELLDLVKELSSKWDPTISNESDPGVILLKVNAIIADKNNYNIDKNILEVFPETVTQLENARSMYKQLAYNMSWYKAATVRVMFKWNQELGKGVKVEIPRYTMLSNESSSSVFTLLTPIEFTRDFVVTSAEAMQGTIVTHTVNGSDLITLSHLDSNNRLYLNSYSVAENGVFITNDGSNSELWTRVDNLQVKTKGSKLYEFGVDVRNGVCYVEFPEDISNLIGTGLRVKYIVTDGAAGNISAKELDRLYEELTVKVGTEDVAVTTDVLQLYNASAAVDGYDPESITEAYRRYQKVAGTFNTLVTLRDYVNAIYNSGFVANCQVCDRFNDPQSAYTVVTDDVASPHYIYQATSEANPEVVSYAKLTGETLGVAGTYVYDAVTHEMREATSSDTGDRYYRYSDATTKDLTAFDLRMYLLNNPGNVNSVEQYESTFSPLASDSLAQRKVEAYLHDQQCVAHDFKGILPDKPFMFKLVYPLGIKIVPQYKLQQTDIDSVKQNITKALIKILNSRNVEFGDEPNYDIIYDTIASADERIKVVILDDFDYTAFATYWNGKQFVEVPVSESSLPYVIYADTDNDLSDIAARLQRSKDSKDAVLLKSAYFIARSAIQDAMIYKYNEQTKQLELYSDKLKQFQTDIIAKSVLAGVTPLFKQNTKFRSSVTNNFVAEEESDRITTDLVVSPFADPNSLPSNGDKFVDTTINQDAASDGEKTIILPTVAASQGIVSAEYTLKDNETVRFLAPSFITQTSFSNYAKFEFVKASVTGSGYSLLNPRKDVVSSTARINLNDFKKLVTHDVTLMSGAYVKDDGQNALSLVLDTQASSPASAAVFAYRDAEPNATYTVEIDSPNINSLWVKVEAYQFGDCRGNVSVISNEPLSSSTYSVTLGEHHESFKIHLYTVISSSYASIKQVKIESSAIPGSRKCWSFAKGPEYSRQTTLTWQRIENTNYWLWEYGKLSDITAFDGSLEYSLWDTGVINLYAPKDVRNVPADTEYQLQEGDSLTVFYKLEDSDTAPYNYQCFKGTSRADSPIIKPSFELVGVAASEAKVSTSKLYSEGVIPYGGEDYFAVNDFVGDKDLSGSKQILLRRMNQLNLEQNKHQFYFITNNIVNIAGTDHYKLRLKLFKTDNNIAQYRYSLDTDEYFVYTDKQQTGLEILGAGTLVGVDKTYEAAPESTLEMTVPLASSNAIAELGLAAIPEWCTVTDSMFVREQQIHNVVGGDKLMVQIDLDQQSCFTILYDDGSTVVYDYVKSHSTKINRPFFTSIGETFLSGVANTANGSVNSGFSVSYKPSGSENVTTLPEIAVKSADAGWSGRACLNLAMDANEPQILVPVDVNRQALQSISIGDVILPKQDVTSIETIVPSSSNDTSNNVYVESDVAVNKVGGQNIDASYVQLDGTRLPVSFYAFTLVPGFNIAPFRLLDNVGTVELTYSQIEGTEVEWEVDLSAGNYIIPVDHQSLTPFQGLHVPEDVKLEVLSSPLINKGRYYYRLNIDSATDEVVKVKFKVLANNDNRLESTDTMIIHPMFKFDLTDEFEVPYVISAEQILSAVQALDIESKFKYDYVVPEEHLIADPLEGKQFFNIDHVFNSNSISKAELRTVSAGSYTHIINNR